MIDDCIPDVKGESVGLLMTYRCNLDCKYCYIRQKQNKDMTFGMAQSILRPFLLDEDSGWLDIIFVGGETLLAFDVIKQTVEWAESLQTKRSYRFFGSTNDTLLNAEMKNWLSDHNPVIAPSRISIVKAIFASALAAPSVNLGATDKPSGEGVRMLT